MQNSSFQTLINQLHGTVILEKREVKEGSPSTVPVTTWRKLPKAEAQQKCQMEPSGATEERKQRLAFNKAKGARIHGAECC